ncbi:ASCH domain-containing protein [Desulfobulbus rhabdoformis]|uniref:ASCH domain-containing protein n=1 Tax=Desulfobulbus rhabdoformis TaxID=34032 RepID=UPI00196427D8|nr:ASCH domain-containing protein [Desulfobulbus rhabdoformis]MBM9616315.1 ASCH domain-containing protein [Desulfobulbus rhabdoformis]
MDKATRSDVIMISIHPKFAHAIFRGEKKVEFRKLNIPRHVEHVVMYVTAPEGKIAGYFSVKDVIEANPSELWRKFKKVSGTTEDFFFGYYGNQDAGLGLLVDRVEVFKNPIALDQIATGCRPPQSFTYVDNNLWKALKRRKKHTKARSLEKSEL